MQHSIYQPYSVMYKAMNGGASAGTAAHGHYRTLAEAEAGAAVFFRANPQGYDVWITKPLMEVRMQTPPVITEDLKY